MHLYSAQVSVENMNKEAGGWRWESEGMQALEALRFQCSNTERSLLDLRTVSKMVFTIFCRKGTCRMKENNLKCQTCGKAVWLFFHNSSLVQRPNIGAGSSYAGSSYAKEPPDLRRREMEPHSTLHSSISTGKYWLVSQWIVKCENHANRDCNMRLDGRWLK